VHDAAATVPVLFGCVAPELVTMAALYEWYCFLKRTSYALFCVGVG
jgi:hypothetical protein